MTRTTTSWSSSHTWTGTNRLRRLGHRESGRWPGGRRKRIFRQGRTIPAGTRYGDGKGEPSVRPLLVRRRGATG
jgi:hypothetical protein